MSTIEIGNRNETGGLHRCQQPGGDVYHPRGLQKCYQLGKLGKLYRGISPSDFLTPVCISTRISIKISVSKKTNKNTKKKKANYSQILRSFLSPLEFFLQFPIHTLLPHQKNPLPEKKKKLFTCKTLDRIKNYF